jgi:cytochrome c
MMKTASIVMAALAGALIAAPAHAGDAAAGARVFKAQCSVCHATTAGAPAGVGPRLNGVVGRKAGSAAGFAYSPAMKGSGLVWSTAELKRYLADPARAVKGNRMPYAGLKNPGQLDDVVAFLATLR